jgi:hypothetical protein
MKRLVNLKSRRLRTIPDKRIASGESEALPTKLNVLSTLKVTEQYHRGFLMLGRMIFRAEARAGIAATLDHVQLTDHLVPQRCTEGA